VIKMTHFLGMDMTMQKIKILLFGIPFVFLISASPAFPERMITLEDAYRSASFNSEALLIARENLIQSEEEVRRAKSFLYPNVSADLNYLRRPKALRKSGFLLRSESETRFDLTLSQPLYTGGRAEALYRSEKLARVGEKIRLSLTTEDLLFEIAQAYYEALKTENNVKIEVKELERLKEHRKNAAKQLEVGEVSQTVLLRAEAELSDARAKLIRAQNAQSAARDQLALLAKIEGAFKLKDPARTPLSKQSESSWIETALGRRLELQEEEIAIKRAGEGLELARGNFLPLLSLDLSYRWTDQQPQGSFLIQNDTFAELKLRVPIFEGMLRQAELSQAHSRMRQSFLLKRQMEDEISVSIRRALLNLSSLTGELRQLEDRIRFARKAFSLASRQFDVGIGTHIDVLDANAALLDAERRRSNARYDREIALLKLKKESGVFSPLSVSP